MFKVKGRVEMSIHSAGGRNSHKWGVIVAVYEPNLA